MKVLAIIPCRGGSKGIPRKNIATVAGRPLLGWTVRAALNAKSIDRVIASTDDPQIAEVARQEGAEVPFLRPSTLARDDTPAIPPLVHAVETLSATEGYAPDAVMMLQPTSPLRTSHDIDTAMRVLAATAADTVVSVTEPSHHPYWMKRTLPDGSLVDLLPQEKPALRRQDLPEALALNGAIFVSRTPGLLARGSWYGGRTMPYRMPPERSLDIDQPWEMALADILLARVHEVPA